MKHVPEISSFFKTPRVEERHKKRRETMNHSRQRLVIFLLSCFFFAGIFTPVAEGREGKWILVGFTKYRDAFFMDSDSIYPSAGNMVTVWTAIAPSKKSPFLRQIKEILISRQKPAGSFKSVVSLYQIDCKKNQYGTLIVIYYDTKGATLHSVHYSQLNWQPIEPGSLWYSLQTAVCAGK
jgi:hypothetical protein